MLVRQAGKYGIIPIPSGKVELKETINTDNMHVSVNLAEEWTNIFNESWRQMRDFFMIPGCTALTGRKYMINMPNYFLMSIIGTT